MPPHYRNITILIIAALLLSALVFVFVPPVSAIRIEQGNQDNPNSIVYLNETVDISLAITWPDYTIAWCDASDYYCDPPDQVIEVSGFQHSFWADPSLLHVGQYYRWSGVWNHGENQDAFYVRAGTRPVINETPVINVTPTPAPGIDNKGNGPFHYLIARGDSPIIYSHFLKDSDVCGNGENQYDGYFWAFGVSSMRMNVPMERKGDDYMYPMTIAATEGLATGDYTGYLQFTGRNGLQDVFVSANGNYLASPYDEMVVPKIKIDSTGMTETPGSIKTKFENMVKSAKYSDDLLIPITMTVKNPEVIIENIVQNENGIWVSGRTTWANGTELTIKLDPDNYKLPSDIRQHTWTTTITGDITEYRHFETEIPLDTKELYIGKHWLAMSVEKNGYITTMNHDFDITGTYIMPTPTPQFHKVMTYANGTPIEVVTPEMYVSTVPTTMPVETEQTTVLPTLNVTEVITTEPTPLPTEPTPVPTEVIAVPLSPLLLFVAVPFALGLWRIRE